MKIKVFDSKIEIEEALVAETREEISRQVGEYFQGERKDFELEVNFPDSFTGRVMREMSKIPFGETRTYGEIARKLDSAPIAVGQACGRNPIPVIVPCHRVIGESSLGGYAYGEDLKRRLIEFEK